MGLEPKSYFYESVMAACASSIAPLLVIIDKVFWMDYFNSSGGWLTGFVNSLVNIVIFNFATYIITYKNKDEYPRCFGVSRRELLELEVYGDDNMWNVLDSDFAKIFNMKVIKSFIFDYFGMGYTTPTKGEIESPFLEKDEISFLARRFKIEGGNVKAPLEEDSIYSMLNWIRKPSPGLGITLDDQYSQNIETAMQEWYHYGKTRFEKEGRVLRDHCREIGLEYPALEFHTYSQRWLRA
jgi:hypothetical protein